VPVCSRHRRGTCQFGRKGEGCRYSHPKICRAMLLHGSCAAGATCRYLHPELCFSSVRERTCFKEDCFFFHLKGTARRSPPVYNPLPPFATVNRFSRLSGDQPNPAARSDGSGRFAVHPDTHSFSSRGSFSVPPPNMSFVVNQPGANALNSVPSHNFLYQFPQMYAIK
jgi:hypothetical protein